jgi:hypothetical protein
VSSFLGSESQQKQQEPEEEEEPEEPEEAHQQQQHSNSNPTRRSRGPSEEHHLSCFVSVQDLSREFVGGFVGGAFDGTRWNCSCWEAAGILVTRMFWSFCPRPPEGCVHGLNGGF